MLYKESTAARMAAKLAEALSNPPIKQITVADECGVSKQAVQGWLKTGRFDKKHLPNLARITGRPLEWWLESSLAPTLEPKSSASRELNNVLLERLSSADPTTIKLVELALFADDANAAQRLSPSLLAMVRGLKAAIEAQS